MARGTETEGFLDNTCVENRDVELWEVVIDPSAKGPNGRIRDYLERPYDFGWRSTGLSVKLRLYEGVNEATKLVLAAWPKCIDFEAMLKFQYQTAVKRRDYEPSNSQLAATPVVPLQGPLETTLGLQVNGSIPSPMRFAVEIEAFVTVMAKAMQPIGCCIDLNKVEQHCFTDLTYDPPGVHSSDAYKQDYHSITAESTIFTVVALALVSEAFNDLVAAEKHLHGLYQLVKLRSGITALG
ncbi:hypothetical protein ETB97_008299 [Aspergillus alliaceus]|uniref:Uncharacterized protein n=1 Tax=Petromyces alliaceus TaxID=209559 RepID=A0A8H6E2I4_PETAA|nr:hypothetical protein ETB97_008299 [Aspergillus burnettii]